MFYFEPMGICAKIRLPLSLTMQSLVKQIRWSFLGKWLMVERCLLFLPKKFVADLSFDKFLNQLLLSGC